MSATRSALAPPPEGSSGADWAGRQTRLEAYLPRAPLTSPTVPAGYEILAEVGRGGMAVVYRARQVHLDRLVALKVLRNGPHADPELRLRFQREAEAVARLQHPNIVQIHDAGEQEGCLFLALEFVDGPNLAEFLGSRRLSPHQAARLVITLARAIHHAHERGIVHRDLKPANVLLARRPGIPPGVGLADAECLGYEPKITDFGLVKHLDDRHGQTPNGAFLGTPNYMAPEQAVSGRQPISPATDVYALGAILYELLTGRPPFQAETIWLTIAQLTSVDPLPPSWLQPTLPAALETICLQALAKTPAHRYVSAAALAADLDRFLAGSAIRARPPSWVGKVLRRVRHRPWVSSLVVLLLLLAAGLATTSWILKCHRVGQAVAALQEGREQMQGHHYSPAARAFCRGLESVRGEDSALTQALETELRRARAGEAVDELHHVADQLRFLFDPDSLPVEQLQVLDEHCRHRWEARTRLPRSDEAQDPEIRQQLETDLLDLACLWTDLRVRLASASEAAEVRRQALAVLAEAEARCGPNLVLERQRREYAVALGLVSVAQEAERRGSQHPARSAWEHYALGRSWLRAGFLERAAAELDQALALQPQGFWLHFYRGVCAYRQGDYTTADKALSVCIALAPEAAPCYYNRALVHTAAHRLDQAAHDLDRAFQLQPTLAALRQPVRLPNRPEAPQAPAHLSSPSRKRGAGD